jgi:hypothetical protein
MAKIASGAPDDSRGCADYPRGDGSGQRDKRVAWISRRRLIAQTESLNNGRISGEPGSALGRF